MFLENQEKTCHKWLNYFPIYEKYLSKWIDQDCTLLEIGVFKGGSLKLWKKYLGHRAKIIGIDIDSKCTDHADATLDIHIRIGNQTDTKFLDHIIKEFGPLDIIIDDGGHRMDQLSASFYHLYPHLNKNGIYLLEDLHTCYWEQYGGGVDKPESFINKTKDIIDQLNARQSRGNVDITNFSKDTYGIYVHNGVVVFEKGSPGLIKSIMTGGKSV